MALPSPGMALTARAAARLLVDFGVTRNQTRQLLADGFAGAASPMAGALLYDEERVWDLAARSTVSPAEMAAVCRGGLLTARRRVDLARDRDEQLATVSAAWPFSRYTWIVIDARIKRHGSLPVVAAWAGFVSLGAEIVSTRRVGTQASTGVPLVELDLVEPGEWFEAFRERRWPTGRGREWSLSGWHPYATRSGAVLRALQE